MRFDEERTLRRSREVDHVEQQAPQQGSTPQVLESIGGSLVSGGSPTSVVTGSQGTDFQSIGSPQATRGASSSGGHTPREDFPTPVQEATSGKRRPRWLCDALQEVVESLGKPKWLVRESKPPERLGGCVARVVETEIASYKETTNQQI